MTHRAAISLCIATSLVPIHDAKSTANFSFDSGWLPQTVLTAVVKLPINISYHFPNTRFNRFLKVDREGYFCMVTTTETKRYHPMVNLMGSKEISPIKSVSERWVWSKQLANQTYSPIRNEIPPIIQNGNWNNISARQNALSHEGGLTKYGSLKSTMYCFVRLITCNGTEVCCYVWVDINIKHL